MINEVKIQNDLYNTNKKYRRNNLRIRRCSKCNRLYKTRYKHSKICKECCSPKQYHKKDDEIILNNIKTQDI
jgi:Zn finger protein HypA/HybF involved in hydrogenase expression